MKKAQITVSYDEEKPSEAAETPTDTDVVG